MSKRRVVLHIGTPKTGTTYIQHCLLINREQLARDRILVPLSGSESVLFKRDHINYMNSSIHHHLLSFKYQEWRVHTFDQARRDKFASIESDFAREYSGKDFDVALFSSECLYWGLRDLQYIKNLSDSFRDFEVKLVVFLRDPFGLLESGYGHSIRYQEFKGSVEQYLNRHLDVIDYKRGLQLWLQVFGRDNVAILPYPQKKSDNIFLTLLDECGTPYDREQLQLPKGLANSSVSPIFADVIGKVFRQNLIEASDVRMLLNYSVKVPTPDLPLRFSNDATIDRLEKLYASPDIHGIPREMVLEWSRGFAKARARIPVAELRLGQVADALGQLCREVLLEKRAATKSANVNIAAHIEARRVLAERARKLSSDINDRREEIVRLREALRARDLELDKLRGEPRPQSVKMNGSQQRSAENVSELRPLSTRELREAQSL